MESYVKMKKRSHFGLYSTRYLVLQSNVIYVFYERRDVCNHAEWKSNALFSFEVGKGGAWGDAKEFYIQDTLSNYWYFIVKDRKLSVKWINALYAITNAKVRERRPSSEKKSVSFYETVKVRKVPAFSPEECDDLFYTSDEIQAFMKNAPLRSSDWFPKLRTAFG